jgi:hemerythrin
MERGGKGGAGIAGIRGVIAGFRKGAGMGAAEAALGAGLPPALYGRYEAGDPGVPVKALHRLAGLFGVDVAALLTQGRPGLRGAVVCRAGGAVEVVPDPPPGYLEAADEVEDGGLEEVEDEGAGGAPAAGEAPAREFREEIASDPAKRVIDWQPAYSTGMNFFDGPHREFVSLINELHMARRAGLKHSQAAFVRVIRYAIRHFQTDLQNEERIMERVGYPEYRAHKKEHAAFLRRILAQGLAFKRGEADDTRDFVRFLKDWVLSHVCITDKKLGAYLIKLKKEGGLDKIIMRVRMGAGRQTVVG